MDFERKKIITYQSRTVDFEKKKTITYQSRTMDFERKTTITSPAVVAVHAVYCCSGREDLGSSGTWWSTPYRRTACHSSFGGVLGLAPSQSAWRTFRSGTSSLCVGGHSAEGHKRLVIFARMKGTRASTFVCVCVCVCV